MELPSGMKFWVACDSRLLAAQRGQGNGVVTGTDYTPELFDKDLEAEAAAQDGNRRSWEFSVASPAQEEMDAIRMAHVAAYTDWIDAGRPTVPNPR